MSEDKIKERIIKVFQDFRELPNAHYDESHILDYLTSPPHSKNSIKGSFKGAKYYYRFMDKLEIEFGICFRMPDLDKYYSLNALSMKVSERLAKHRGNLNILKQRQEEKSRYYFEILLFILVCLSFAWFKIHWFPISLAVISGLIIYWLVSKKVYERNHVKKMAKILNNHQK